MSDNLRCFMRFSLSLKQEILKSTRIRALYLVFLFNPQVKTKILKCNKNAYSLRLCALAKREKISFLT